MCLKKKKKTSLRHFDLYNGKSNMAPAVEVDKRWNMSVLQAPSGNGTTQRQTLSIQQMKDDKGCIGSMQTMRLQDNAAWSPEHVLKHQVPCVLVSCLVAFVGSMATPRSSGEN